MFSFLEDEHPFVDFLYLKDTTTQIRKLTMCFGKPGLATGGALFWGWDWRAPNLRLGTNSASAFVALTTKDIYVNIPEL